MNIKSSIWLLLCCLGWAGLQGQQVGEATYYADKFQGRPTASGELFDQSRFTAAHKTLAFGTYVRITNLTNGLSVDVRINDRMPKSNPRMIDLSRAAATQIDMIRAGRAQVRMDILSGAGNSAQGANAGTYPNQTSSSGLPAVDLEGLPVTDQNGFPVDADNATTNPSPGGGTGGGNLSSEEALKYTPTLFFMGASKTYAEGFAVQIAAFNSFYRLLEGLDEIYAKGENRTLVHSGMKDGKPIFRILVGPFESRTDADQAKKELKKMKLDGWVVPLAQLGG